MAVLNPSERCRRSTNTSPFGETIDTLNYSAFRGSPPVIGLLLMRVTMVNVRIVRMGMFQPLMAMRMRMWFTGRVGG